MRCIQYTAEIGSIICLGENVKSAKQFAVAQREWKSSRVNPLRATHGITHSHGSARVF